MLRTSRLGCRAANAVLRWVFGHRRGMSRLAGALAANYSGYERFPNFLPCHLCIPTYEVTVSDNIVLNDFGSNAPLGFQSGGPEGRLWRPLGYTAGGLHVSFFSKCPPEMNNVDGSDVE